MIQHLKSAFYHFSREKMMSIINVTGLGIGLATTALIFLWVSNEFSYDRDIPDASHIYMVTWTDKTNTNHWDGSPGLFAQTVKQELPGISEATRYLPGTSAGVSVSAGGATFLVTHSMHTDPNWFRFFPEAFLSGSPAEFSRPGNQAVLTQSLARKLFGHREALDAVILVDTTRYIISGVVPDPSNHTSLPFTLILKNRGTPAPMDQNWAVMQYKTLIRLQPGVNKSTVTTELGQLLNRKRPPDGTKAQLLAL
ncbi:MAG: ABC transporter permease, partial [Bacteroidota bacterium]|nr:ABC transporter permease [Bacteroidota bacterium]